VATSGTHEPSLAPHGHKQQWPARELPDKDAVDPSTRAWLEWLRQNSPDFRPAEGQEVVEGRVYKSLTGTITDVQRASIVACTRLARNEIEESLKKGSESGRVRRGRGAQEVKDRAARRDSYLGGTGSGCSAFSLSSSRIASGHYQLTHQETFNFPPAKQAKNRLGGE
jgi:hypothetical protein